MKHPKRDEIVQFFCVIKKIMNKLRIHKNYDELLLEGMGKFNH